MREGKIGAGRESPKPGLDSTRWVEITASLVYDAWMQAVRAANHGKEGNMGITSIKTIKDY